MLGDRFGRARMMAATILVYSVFSVADGFRTVGLQVHVLRFLVALGTGGEWAIAAALVAETFPRIRGPEPSGVFHASSVIGTGLASLTGMLFSEPGRVAMGLPPGPAACALVLWIRVGISRTRRWISARRPRRPTDDDPVSTATGSTGRSRALRRASRALRQRAVAIAGARWAWAWPPSVWRPSGASSPGAPSSPA